MIQRVAVIGLGTMGTGIAQVFAAAGCEVACFDSVPAARAALRERVSQNLRTLADAGLVESAHIEPALRRIVVCDSESDAAKPAEFVLEAVAEDLAVKQALFERLEKIAAPDAILASNTSTLRLADMTARLRDRSRTVVAHWFNPAHIVPVVEVAPGPHTSDDTMTRTIELLRHSKKLPIRLAREIPGFIVNRVQAAMIREVWSLLEQGIATPEEIDLAIRGSMGFRLAASGPLEIADFGGLDVWRKVFENLAPQIESGTTLPEVIREKVDSGHFGPKTSKGIYDYPSPRLEQVRGERDRRMLALAKLLWSSPRGDACVALRHSPVNQGDASVAPTNGTSE